MSGYDWILTSQTQIDIPTLNKQLIPETLDYYGTCLIWAGIVRLKVKLNQPLTDVERTLQDILNEHSFNVPEPLRRYLLMFGK